METGALALGIDLGTTGVRICALAEEGVRAEARAPLSSQVRVGRTHEQDPSAWWSAVTACLAELRNQIDGQSVRALAVDGTSGTLLMTDRAGGPLGPALMYDDERAVDEAEAIRLRAPPNGIGHSSASPLAKALWLIRHRLPTGPFVFAHQADWVAGRFCATFGVTDENNALKTGYDPVARRWPEWIAALGLPPSCLPEVRPAGSPMGRLDAALAAEFGLSPNCQVILGTTDSIAGFLATGASQVGDAATSLGTTLAIKMLVREPVFDPASGIYSHRLGDAWLVGGASNAGGAVLLQHFTPEEIHVLSAQIEPDVPSGFSYYPLVRTGERFPIFDPNLLPRIEPRPDDRRTFLKALFEGLAEIERLAYEKLAQLSKTEPRRIYATGGVCRNPAFARIRSRILKLPLVDCEGAEAAQGVARLAWKSIRR